MSDVEQLLAAITPERLRPIILEMVASKPPDERRGVDVSSLVGRLTEGYDLGRGPARSQTYQQLIAAIRASVAQLDSMEYVKSSD